VERAAGLLNLELDAEPPPRVPAVAGGTPRIAIGLLRRVRDVARACAANTRIGPALVAEALSLHRSTTGGLDAQRPAACWSCCFTGYGGGPVGLDTLAAGLAEGSDHPWKRGGTICLQTGFLTAHPPVVGWPGRGAPASLAWPGGGLSWAVLLALLLIHLWSFPQLASIRPDTHCQPRGPRSATPLPLLGSERAGAWPQHDASGLEQSRAKRCSGAGALEAAIA